MLAKVSPKGIDILGNATLTEDVSWTLPTLVSTRLFVRDRTHILALELGKSRP
jgi:hypothetical protein